MKVGLLIYGSLEEVSGGYLYDRKLAHHLTSMGEEVRVFSMPWRSYQAHLLDNLRAIWLERMARARLDVLLQDELNHPSLFLLNRRLRSRVAYPIISLVHHLRCRERWRLPERLLYRAVEKRYLASVDGFVFNSASTRRSVEEALGHSVSGVIAYPGGDRLGPPIQETEIIARAGRGGPLRLVFVGNLIPRKGLDGLLLALAAIREEPWELSVIGSLKADPDYAARIRREMKALGLEGKVRLMGYLPDKELAALLRHSDMMAMPFSYEGFGIAHLEGTAYGLPSLACHSGGVPEIILDGRNGYLLNPGELGRLSSLLSRLIGDRNALLELSLAARRRFNAFPSWKQTAATVRDFLRQAISCNRRPVPAA